MKFRLKESIFALISFVLVVVICLICVELAVRYLIYHKGIYLKYIDRPHWFALAHEDPGYQFPEEFYQLDDRYGWRHTPNNDGEFRGWRYPHAEFRTNVSINTEGFRDTEDYIVAPHKFRVAVLGDSFIQAVQVEQDESIPEQVEAGLESADIDAMVYNFGVSSIGTIHQYRIFQEEVVRLKPDVVVLSFFPNDLVDNSPNYKKERPQLAPRYEFDRSGQIRIFPFDRTSQEELLISHPIHIKQSDRLDAATARVNTLRRFSQSMPYLKSLEFLKLYMIDRLGLRTDYDYPFDVYRKDYPPELQESVRLMHHLLLKLKAETQAIGADFVVLMLPAREQVLPQYWQEHVAQRRYILNADDFDLQKPTRELKAFLEGQGIHHLDLMPVFTSAPDPESLYYKFDHHFNARGHALAAEHLLPILTRIYGHRQ